MREHAEPLACFVDRMRDPAVKGGQSRVTYARRTQTMGCSGKGTDDEREDLSTCKRSRVGSAILKCLLSDKRVRTGPHASGVVVVGGRGGQ